MPAPLGNQYAVGNEGGRPRTTSLPPESMIALGEEMIEWIKNHPDILHLSQWYTIEKMFTYNEWKKFIEKQEFRPYYEKALKMVGIKYLDKESNVKDNISQRWQRLYFKDLREEEDETKEFESSLKVKEAKAGTPEERAKTDAVIEMLDKLQAERSSKSP